MRKIIIHGVMMCALLIASCNKDETSPESSKHSELPKQNYVININTTRDAGNILSATSDSLIYVGNNKATRSGDIISSTEFMASYVMLYLGGMFLASTVANNSFEPIICKRTPISVSCSLLGTSREEIQNVAFSSYNKYLTEQIKTARFPENSGYSINIGQFTLYDELYPVLGNSNEYVASLSRGKKQISQKTGLYLLVSQESFKNIMDYPQGQDALIPANKINEALYISSISYGQATMVALETNLSATEAYAMLKSIATKIFASNSAFLTSEEQQFAMSSDAAFFILGRFPQGPTFLDALVSMKNSKFSQQNPGAPLYYTCNYVKDNSPFSMFYRLNVNYAK